MSSFEDGCFPCTSLLAPAVSYSWGAANCIPPCAAGQAYDASLQACVAGCDASLGLYHRSEAYGGGCLQCPRGTTPSVGDAGCVACQSGTIISRLYRRDAD